MSATIDLWVNDELHTIDTLEVWTDTFIEWDGLVDTDTAAALATATANIIEAWIEQEQA